MIKQMFLMIWNRKKQNALMTVGIVISFFSLFLVFTTLFYMLSNYFKPLGFEYEDVWYMNPGWSVQEPEEILETIRQVEFALDSYPEIESHSYSNCLLFVPAAMSTSAFMNNGKEVTVNKGLAGDHFDEVLEIDLIAGRWLMIKTMPVSEHQLSLISRSRKNFSRTRILSENCLLMLMGKSSPSLGRSVSSGALVILLGQKCTFLVGHQPVWHRIGLIKWMVCFHAFYLKFDLVQPVSSSREFWLMLLASPRIGRLKWVVLMKPVNLPIVKPSLFRLS